MLGLNETATLCRYAGRRGGRPAFAEPGEAFACRSEPATGRSARSDSFERSANLRVFADDIGARPGDRIELDGARYRIAEVKRLRGWMGTHHLEIAAKAEERGEPD